VLRKMAREQHLPLTVFSRGLAAYPGDGAMPQAVEAAAEIGEDLANHRAAALTVADVNAADLLFVMSESHKKAIVNACPEAKDRIFVMRIPDPYGMPLAVYRKTLAEIEQYFDRFFKEQEGWNEAD